MTAARRLLVYGAGGHGKVVADVGRSIGFACAGFLDDDPAKDGTSFFGARVMTWARFQREAWVDAMVALGIGDNAARERCFDRIRAAGHSVATLVHESAIVAPSAQLGPGTVVMALAAVNPDAVVGEGAILNTGSVVEHDCRLGRFVHLSPNAALGGRVSIGDRTHLGLGAVALPGLRIGSDIRVGAGAVVIRDVADGLTLAGVPARPIPGNGRRGGTP
jgi:sugar O-acyltransferase (sialic acid O-acetyltransferase NeuD family)